MKRILVLALAVASAMCIGCNRPKDGEYTLNLLTTNDVHGTWFSESYGDGNPKRSLFAVNSIVSRFRDSVGAENVILVDAGDCLQGDNAAYYFNFVDTASAHLFPRLASYMKYDAVCVGNHDIETGHSVYDRVRAELEASGIPFLGGNAIKNTSKVSAEKSAMGDYPFKDRYFQTYRIIRRGGLKVAVLGYTNPNMKAWLMEDIWSGMTFVNLIPLVQKDVDKVREKEKPQVVIVAVHSGTGEGNGESLESQGLDLLSTLKGVDFLVCSHDHRPFVAEKDSICLINSGSHARNVGHGSITLTIKDGKVVSKSLHAENIKVNAENIDTAMRDFFQEDFLKVREFTLSEVGKLKKEIRTRDALCGMSDYINLVHTLGFYATDARISIAAPLTYNKTIEAGTLNFNDLFTFYPYENQLFTIKLTGSQIRNYLEQSYDGWITSEDPEHVLKIQQRDDPRNSQKVWSFMNRSYNFDSAAGICYTVDVTKPLGQRIEITSMADGTPFDTLGTYKVAMTSYRASGGGDLLKKSGVDPDGIDSLIVDRNEEYRKILYRYLKEKGSIDPDSIGRKEIIGHWEFIPSNKARKLLDKDMRLLFGEE